MLEDISSDRVLINLGRLLGVFALPVLTVLTVSVTLHWGPLPLSHPGSVLASRLWTLPPCLVCRAGGTPADPAEPLLCLPRLSSEV